MEFSYLWGTLSVVKLYDLSYFVGLMVLGLAVWFGLVELAWLGLGWVGLVWFGLGLLVCHGGKGSIKKALGVKTSQKLVMDTTE